MQKTHTFLMFQDGRAEEAMKFYTSLLKGEIKEVHRYGPEAKEMEGKVVHAVFSMAGLEYMAIDSNVKHEFGFTPSISISVQCADEAEIDRLWAALSEGGEVRMPLDKYPWGRKYGWCDDRYGVSWQLNWA